MLILKCAFWSDANYHALPTLPYLTLPYLTLPYLTLPYDAVPAALT